MSSMKQHLSDFANGIKDTFIGAPYAFGDFLARLSGFRDWQENNKSVIPNLNSNYYQEQAFNEMKIIYHAFKNLKIWQDKNLNGVVDSGELTNLSDNKSKEYKMADINLNVNTIRSNIKGGTRSCLIV